MNTHIVLFVTLFTGIRCCGDFYWRDYEGVIPSDALLGGTSSDTKLTYIGQAYINNVGLILGNILANEDGIIIASNGIKTTDTAIKILCVADTTKYYWHSTRASEYAQDTSYKCPVLGGYNQTDTSDDNTDIAAPGPLHIGRVTDSGSSGSSNIRYQNTYIGSIAAYNSEPELSYYDYRLNTETVTTYYSVLMYHDYPLK